MPADKFAAGMPLPIRTKLNTLRTCHKVRQLAAASRSDMESVHLEMRAHRPIRFSDRRWPGRRRIPVLRTEHVVRSQAHRSTLT